MAVLRDCYVMIQTEDYEEFNGYVGQIPLRGYMSRQVNYITDEAGTMVIEIEGRNEEL